MKLKAQHVLDATVVVAQIIRENRPLPQKGKYRLARLHAKLLPEFNTLNAQRDAMISAYGWQQPLDSNWDSSRPDVGTPALSPNFSVPPDKLPEFNAAWKEIGDQEIDIEVEPVPLAHLELADNVDGSITGHELVLLGDLVTE